MSALGDCGCARLSDGTLLWFWWGCALAPCLVDLLIRAGVIVTRFSGCTHLPCLFGVRHHPPPGRLFTWGNGNSGRLGLGAEVLGEVTSPTLVRSLVTKGLYVWTVACGAAHTAITTKIEVRGCDKEAKSCATFRLCPHSMGLAVVPLVHACMG